VGYTQTDLENIRAARLKLLTGERVDSITIGSDTVRFAQGVTDEQLARMEAQIAAGLMVGGPTRAYAKNGGRG
jgi:hypothetical protein